MARRRGQFNGGLEKRGDKWLVRWWEDFRAADGSIVRKRQGKVIGKWKGKASLSEPEARRIAQREILLKLDDFTIRPQSLMTVQEFYYKRFKPNHVERSCSLGRQAHYDTLMDKHILPALGARTLREVNLEVVQRFLNTVAASSWTRPIKYDAETTIQSKPKRYSTQTVLHIKNAISAMFSYARDLECFTGRLPTEGVRGIGKRGGEIRRTKRRSLTRDQVRELLARLESPYREMVFFVASTGLRIGELCGLRWKNINFKRAVMEVTEQWDPAFGYRPTKTEESDRLIPIPIPMLARLQLIQDGATFNGPNDPVFATRKGTPIDRRNAQNRHLKPAGKKMGLEGVCWHGLRHSLGSYAHEGGATSTQRKKILGHGTDRMMDHYTVGDVEGMRPILEAIAADLLTPVIPDGRIQ